MTILHKTFHNTKYWFIFPRHQISRSLAAKNLASNIIFTSQIYVLLSKVFFKKMKPILCVGMVCEDTIVKVDKFPIEDSDQRTLDQWKTRGGNASNMCTVISGFDLEVE